MSSWQCGGCGRWYNYTVPGCSCHITYATSESSRSAPTPTNMPAILAQAADDWFAANGSVTVRQAFMAGVSCPHKQRASGA